MKKIHQPRILCKAKLIFQKWRRNKDFHKLKPRKLGELSKVKHLLISLIWNITFFFSLFLIEGKLLYRILLFSVKPQHESAIVIHTSFPLYTSLPSPPTSHPSRLIQSPCLSFLNHATNFHLLSILHMVI